MHALALPPCDGSGFLHLPPALPGANEDIALRADSLARDIEEPFHLERYQLRREAVNVTKTTTEHKWETSMQQIPVPTVNIPRNLKYIDVCGGFCREATPADIFQFAELIQRVLSGLVNKTRRVSNVSLEKLGMMELMFMFELVAGDIAVLKECAQLIVVNAQSGPLPAFQGFVTFSLPVDVAREAPIDAVLMDRVRGQRLTPIHQPCVRSLHPATLDTEEFGAALLPNGGWGELRALTSEEFIYYVCEPREFDRHSAKQRLGSYHADRARALSFPSSPRHSRRRWNRRSRR